MGRVGAVLDIDVRSIDQKNGNFLLRGPRPTSLEAIKDLKCRTIIDLESSLFEFMHDRAYEEDGWAEESGLIIRHLPLSNIFPPTEYEIKAFLSMVGLGLQRGSVYFHCRFGKDRTGIMGAMYRIRVQGWSPASAVDEMLKLGFHRWPYQYWIWSLF